jgi:hypothetical protein
VREYKTFQGVIQATKDIILEAVDHEYLLEIEDEILGFLNQMPTNMMNHLQNHGGAYDFVDTKTLLAERDGEWDASKVPQLYFNRVEKQSMDSPTLESILTSMNIKTWHCTTSKLWESSMQPFESGKTGKQVRRHGKTSKHSSWLSMQMKINKTNSPPNRSKQTCLRKRQKQQKNSLQ